MRLVAPKGATSSFVEISKKVQIVMKQRLIKRLGFASLAGLIVLGGMWLVLGDWGLDLSPDARSYSYETHTYWTDADGVPFSDPFAIAVDERNGNVIVTDVADAYNHRIQQFDRKGTHQASWGWHLFWLVPRPASGRDGLHALTGVAFDPVHQLIHVADSANRRVVMLDAHGAFIADWALPETSERYSPTMLAASSDGDRVYVTDTERTV